MRPLLIIASGALVSALSLDAIKSSLLEWRPQADGRLPHCVDATEDSEAL